MRGKCCSACRAPPSPWRGNYMLCCAPPGLRRVFPHVLRRAPILLGSGLVRGPTCWVSFLLVPLGIPLPQFQAFVLVGRCSCCQGAHLSAALGDPSALGIGSCFSRDPGCFSSHWPALQLYYPEREMEWVWNVMHCIVVRL